MANENAAAEEKSPSCSQEERAGNTPSHHPITIKLPYGNKAALVPLTAEALFEIARVLRADSTLGSLVAQADVRAASNSRSGLKAKGEGCSKG